MTTLGIMQPYFFPYLGHYQLIFATDRWIVFDVVKYGKKSWMNRNRILHPKDGWQYVSVPVSASQGTPVSAVEMVDAAAAERRILGQIEHYRGKAPHFHRVRELVAECFASAGSSRLRDLNVRSLAVVCDYLSIPFRYSLCSEMALELPEIDHAGQWALEISAALGADRYINPPGGRAIFIPQDWKDRGIELRFLEPKPLAYACPPYEPVENLSILDVLMWNDVDVVMEHVRGTLTLSE